MKKYEMLLQDFFNSEEWKPRVTHFWNTYFHTGTVYERKSDGGYGNEIGTYISEPCKCFQSDDLLDTVFKYFERVCNENLWASSDWHRMMLFFYDNCSNPDRLWELDGEEVIEYFLGNCNNERNKFIYIFAVANGLTDEQIMCVVSDKEKANRILNYFLCNKESNINPVNLRHIPRNCLTGVVIKFHNEKEVSAEFEDTGESKVFNYTLRNNHTGELYLIQNEK